MAAVITAVGTPTFWPHVAAKARKADRANLRKRGFFTPCRPSSDTGLSAACSAKEEVSERKPTNQSLFPNVSDTRVSVSSGDAATQRCCKGTEFQKSC
jgi:hypothetical protein